ncbi:MAG: hypothetical protein ABJM06_06445 [Gilvibacter sp.]
MKPLIVLCLSFIVYTSYGQENTAVVPYESIGEYAPDYESGNVVSRFIDGLGYRYHWASKDLTAKDLEYTPSEDGRSMLETLRHICGLSQTIVDASTGKPSLMPFAISELTYDQLRLKTLTNLAIASKALRSKTAEQVSELKVVFKSGENSNEFPFWNMMNGPISDAIYHTGQLVVLRRASGNPIDPNVSVLVGKNRSN